ncbi:hypothetical protein DICSQDRAFT_174047 [Dichomitus squalens LYAD-421 SS1]|uniref:Uncharacterized protein n=1 Tax=Dichomitus squalens (strain LYAD-421) TaxID=732165 RepID=R7SNU4_DICSQ|nr:uncharacterized protein DICSQDRAFT_174047 [Dichomitus squalens LYAD-421 SS1]EJF57405.1 hypothetical protein DICSQDRAFT_174047 [Dichomitus squalens LYAD-421 SS1]
MPSQVRFSEGTKTTDSPNKALIGDKNHTNIKENLDYHRNELRFNMHGKISLIPHADFFDRFLPSMKTPRSESNRFNGLETPSSETDMYKSLSRLADAVVTA